MMAESSGESSDGTVSPVEIEVLDEIDFDGYRQQVSAVLESLGPDNETRRCKSIVNRNLRIFVQE